ncbi:MAG: hypothetical protein ACRC8A_10605 [Microcoleaceae cyanobacterium]
MVVAGQASIEYTRYRQPIRRSPEEGLDVVERVTVMKEQDCLVVYAELVETLKRLGLGWVAEQVVEVVSAGKVVEETVSGRKTPDLKLTYHTPSEQVLLLIQAIEKAVIDTLDIELSLAESLGQEDTGAIAPEIHFTSSLGGQENRFKFTQDAIEHRQKQLKSLRMSLNTLRLEHLNPNA